MERTRSQLVSTSFSVGSRALVVTLASGLALALFPGCGSDSSSGSGTCTNVAGTYSGTDVCGDQQAPANDVVTQTGCTVSIKDTNDDSITPGTVNGNVVTVSVDSNGVKGTCTVTLTGDSYTRKCTGKTTAGADVSCTGSGTRTSKPAGAGGAGNGAGGEGAAGDGAGGGGAGDQTGAGGETTVPVGAGGATGGTACGVTWTDQAQCEGCMETSCCAQMAACGDGTACGTLLDCITANCPTLDPACAQSACSAEYAAGQDDVTALSGCNASACQACQ